MSTVADILAKRRPLEKRVRLLLDGAANAELEDLRREIQSTKARETVNHPGLDSKVPELERRLVDRTLQAEEAAAVFTFRAIPRPAFEDITTRHPPSEEQWALYRDTVRINFVANAPDCDYDAAAPELIAASCAEPQLTVAEAAELWSGLSVGEARTLFNAAWSVNQQATSRPFYGTGTDTTLTSGPDSTMSQNGESPSPSSVEGS